MNDKKTSHECIAPEDNTSVIYLRLHTTVLNDIKHGRYVTARMRATCTVEAFRAGATSKEEFLNYLAERGIPMTYDVEVEPAIIIQDLVCAVFDGKNPQFPVVEAVLATYAKNVAN